MPKAILINAEVSNDIFARVAQRIGTAGCQLVRWSDAVVASADESADIAILVVAQGLNLAGVDDRIQELVSRSLRIIVLMLDDAELPIVATDLAYSRVGIDSLELDAALDATGAAIHEDAVGQSAPVREIKHNKC